MAIATVTGLDQVSSQPSTAGVGSTVAFSVKGRVSTLYLPFNDSKWDDHCGPRDTLLTRILYRRTKTSDQPRDSPGCSTSHQGKTFLSVFPLF